MLMHWAQSHPIQCAVLVLGAVALVVVLVDFLKYFGYYVRDHWTESLWTDDDAGTAENPEMRVQTEKDPAAARTHK